MFLSLICWIIGLVLSIKAALEIYRLEGDALKKVFFIVLIIMCSWLGLIAYYLFARPKMAQWVK